MGFMFYFHNSLDNLFNAQVLCYGEILYSEDIQCAFLPWLDVLPKDIWPNGQLADRRLGEQTFS